MAGFGMFWAVFFFFWVLRSFSNHAQEEQEEQAPQEHKRASTAIHNKLQAQATTIAADD